MKIRVKCLLLMSFATISCSNQNVMLFYYNGLNYNQNYTWGASLQIFFEKDNDMNTVLIQSKELKNNLLIIKEKIISTNNVIVPDDGNYTFAFVSKKDTLFADDRLEFWRYGSRGIYFKIKDNVKKSVLEHYKLNPNQF
ncbi:hypothetical protein [Chryseobacterium indologenes]|uniref:hypothetical protein n=1 Tax=Chryseobacterium indologenes TaxID=253 RepID=UPI0040588923